MRDKRINLDLETRDGRRNRGRLRDMMKPWTRLEHESGMVMNASTPRTKVRAPDGRVREIPAAAESHVAQRPGYRPVEQRKPTLIWRDGIWYRRARGGYVAEPAN
ncbi:MAG TPA: hypothetical protein VJ787_04700 [Thermoleophilia bacterium]|nr:hypothetical protein [Thermoleophilia bacterium]